LNENQSVFQLTITSSVAEIIACFSTSLITYLFNTKRGLIISYVIAILGALGFVFSANALDSNLLPYFVLFTKLGVTMSFNISYVIMNELFPTLLKATSFGMCNIVARLITITSPLVAILPSPYPMLIFVIYACVTSFLCIFLKPIVQKEN
jgi:MFS family permease